MAEYQKVQDPGKVQKESNRKFKIKKDKDNPDEIDADIEILEEGEYEVEKLKMNNLPTHMKDGNRIRWLNNFSIKQNGQFINKPYKVTIQGLSNMKGSQLVIYDGKKDPYYYGAAIVNDTFDLTDGDPATGMAP